MLILALVLLVLRFTGGNLVLDFGHFSSPLNQVPIIGGAANLPLTVTSENHQRSATSQML